MNVTYSARSNTVSFWWYWHGVAHMCCLALLFWCSVLLHLLYLDPIILPWVKRIFSGVASACFWKTKSKHYLVQRRLWWKFLLNAAWENLTMGIVSGLWLVALCQKHCSYLLFLFVLLHFIWAVPHVKCASSYTETIILSFFKARILHKHNFFFKWNMLRYYFFGFGFWLEETCEPCV